MGVTAQFDVDPIPRQWKGLFKGLQGRLLDTFIVVYFLFHLAYVGHLFANKYIYITSDQFIIISILLTFVLFCLLLSTKMGKAKNKIPWYDFVMAGGGAGGRC